jgi:hypothetical protein
MPRVLADLRHRLESLSLRIGQLAGLRELIDLPPHGDLTARQWKLVTRTMERAHRHLADKHYALVQQQSRAPYSVEVAHQTNQLLGHAELELSSAYSVFDTLVDVLTQRQGGVLGRLLKGCDVLADAALRRPHAGLRTAERPVVHFDRGFGASILRAGARLGAGLPTELSLLQLPYSRLADRLHLTSLFHEVGHEALHRLDLLHPLADAVYRRLRLEGASANVSAQFASWTRELGPDVWAFLSSGVAAVCTTREILSLPSSDVFRVLEGDAHPPPYLRVLFGFSLCEVLWGAGPWMQWREEWKALYPVSRRRPLGQAVRYLMPVAKVFLEARWSVLNDRPLPSLFSIEAINPFSARREARRALNSGRLRFLPRPVCAQLAVFRALALEGCPLRTINRCIGQWLFDLAEPDAQRRTFLKETHHAADA